MNDGFRVQTPGLMTSAGPVFEYGQYVQNPQGQSFVDTNGDVWIYPFGSAIPIKVGTVFSQGHAQNAAAININIQNFITTPVPIQFVLEPAGAEPIPNPVPDFRGRAMDEIPNW